MFGRERAGGGGGGEVEFLTEKKISAKKLYIKIMKLLSAYISIYFFEGGGGGGEKFLSFFSLLKFFFFKNVPGVLKRMQTKIYFFGGGGGILGCLGRPTPPPGGRAGSENDTLLPMT